eukprot:scaffold27281_cov29-Phaeocystis_antarctica.AAC.1
MARLQEVAALVSLLSPPAALLQPAAASFHSQSPPLTHAHASPLSPPPSAAHTCGQRSSRAASLFPATSPPAWPPLPWAPPAVLPPAASPLAAPSPAAPPLAAPPPVVLSPAPPAPAALPSSALPSVALQASSPPPVVLPPAASPEHGKHRRKAIDR